MLRSTHRSGFTLVELAIVLVIIGLLVGGVLVGQDLIKGAEIRSVVTFLEKTNAGAMTFRGKFGGLPGDLLNNRAQAFGIIPQSRGAAGAGDGDGQIQAVGGGTANANRLGGENAMFWSDLAQADLISQGFAGAGKLTAPSTTLDVTALQAWLPITSLRDSTFYHIIVSNGRNFFYIDNVSSVAATTGVMTVSGNGLSPGESKSIDEKTDDGSPLTGITQATTGIAATAGGFTSDTGSAAGATVCVNTGVTPADYNVMEDYYNNQTCGLVSRTSF